MSVISPVSYRELLDEIASMEMQIRGIQAFFEPSPHRNAEIRALNAAIAEVRNQIFSLLNTRSGG